MPVVTQATNLAAAAIPDARIHVLEGHAHFAHKTDPDMVAEIIEKVHRMRCPSRLVTSGAARPTSRHTNRTKGDRTDPKVGQSTWLHLEAAQTSRVHACLRWSRQWLPRRGCRRRVGVPMSVPAPVNPAGADASAMVSAGLTGFGGGPVLRLDTDRAERLNRAAVIRDVGTCWPGREATTICGRRPPRGTRCSGGTCRWPACWPPTAQVAGWLIPQPTGRRTRLAQGVLGWRRGRRSARDTHNPATCSGVSLAMAAPARWVRLPARVFVQRKVDDERFGDIRACTTPHYRALNPRGRPAVGGLAAGPPGPGCDDPRSAQGRVQRPAAGGRGSDAQPAGGVAYPLEWEADVLLVDGGVAHLRPCGPADAEAIRAMHGRLSQKTLYMRYTSCGVFCRQQLPAHCAWTTRAPPASAGCWVT